MNGVKIDKKALCIRNASNFSSPKPEDKFPHQPLNAQKFNLKMHDTSPKLVELLRTIKRLDEDDMKRHGKLFKHIVYSDIKSSASGAKMIAGALQSNGFTNAYDQKMKIDKKELERNAYRSFALLCSLKVYEKDITVALKRSILSTFNSREDNVHGEMIRILLLDPGYKEGIDVFDVKYMHLFEPLVTPADETQVIGRGTRFCGQKGLTFEPNIGWPLHVFKYELLIDGELKEKYEAVNVNELFLRNSGLNFEKITFVNELSKLAKFGAVDYALTRNIHNSTITEAKSPIPVIDSVKKSPVISVRFKSRPMGPFRSLKIQKEIKYRDYFKNYSVGGLNKRTDGEKKIAFIQTKKMKFANMRAHIRKNFSKFKWDKVVYENKCVESKDDTKKNKLMTFTPTQDFVSNYFHPNTFNKGMLLWHSVGTGKTCTAISVATTGFEPEGYTILWVTRHTLKSDLWKNMFISVCSAIFRKKVINCDDYMPQDVPKNPLSYLSDRWVMPISYKQFSNMLAGKNDLYKEMVKRNGKNDPLKKTLVIIDEVHKLFSTDVPMQERPDLSVINSKIKNSYKVSGKESVRLLLMTATPISGDPMDLIKILNMMRETDLPDTFENLSKRYLDCNKNFSRKGSELFLDDIAGYVSYLNREKDVRQFAYPVFYKVNAVMSRRKEDADKIVKDIEAIQEKIDQLSGIPLKDKTKDEKNSIKEDIKKLKVQKKEMSKMNTIIKKMKTLDDNSQENAFDKCLKE